MMESTGYMQYAPFIGTPSVSKEANRGTTPLYRTVCAMVDKINGVWSGADKPPWSSSVTFEDVRRCAKCAARAHVVGDAREHAPANDEAAKLGDELSAYCVFW